ncbi:MAG: CHAD domain-containing protein [Acidobacteriota bacterium]|nr:MAG: CHAD domain-containing protein [Acidobacteriota bacterium]
MSTQAFELNQPEKELVGQLADLLSLGKREVWTGHVTYYDTFDWRLFRSGWTLVTETSPSAQWLILSSLQEERAYRSRLEQRPGFSESLPDGMVRTELEPVLKIRRLLPLVEIRCSRRTFRLLDTEKKTLAYLHFVRGKVRKPGSRRYAGELPASFELEPVTGYLEEFAQLKSTIEGLNPLVPIPSLLDQSLNFLGRAPLDYSSKVSIELAAEMSAGEAVRQVYQTLLGTVLANESGTRADLDSEFLHDFRVAIRRTRAALTQIKGVIPQEVTDHFKREFSWLGRVTGPTRDMDVYLLEYPKFVSDLPPEVGLELQPLKSFLTEHHRTEQELLVRALNSRRYRRLVQDWKTFLESSAGNGETAPNAGVPVREVASGRIWRVFRRIVKKGNRIDDSSPADALHEVRLDCKKLRYLLEFFTSLYDSDQMKQLIKALKVLQDNLGEFNDCQVQQEKLKEFAEQMMAEGSVGSETLLAMGRLVERLDQRQLSLRSQFSQRFESFASGSNVECFRTLFAATEG